MQLTDRARRRLYRGRRARRLARQLNAVQARFAGWGIGPAYLAVLEVTGRRTGRTISLPVVVAEFDGGRYLVSMLGGDANWVRNVRAAAGCAALRLRGHRSLVRLEEVGVDRRAPILRSYVRRARGARAHIRVAPDAPLTDFERVAADYPVFKIVTAE